MILPFPDQRRSCWEVVFAYLCEDRMFPKLLVHSVSSLSHFCLVSVSKGRPHSPDRRDISHTHTEWERNNSYTYCLLVFQSSLRLLFSQETQFLLVFQMCLNACLWRGEELGVSFICFVSLFLWEVVLFILWFCFVFSHSFCSQTWYSICLSKHPSLSLEYS